MAWLQDGNDYIRADSYDCIVLMKWWRSFIGIVGSGGVFNGNGGFGDFGGITGRGSGGGAAQVAVATQDLFKLSFNEKKKDFHWLIQKLVDGLMDG